MANHCLLFSVLLISCTNYRDICTFLLFSLIWLTANLHIFGLYCSAVDLAPPKKYSTALGRDGVTHWPKRSEELIKRLHLLKQIGFTATMFI
jgi:hypothetical protein